MVGNAVRGGRDVLRGAKFLVARPRLWPLIAAPAGLSLVLLIAVGVLGFWLLDPAIDTLVEWLPAALERWAGGALRILATVAFLLSGFVVFLSLAVLVAAPFNEMLSAAVERELTGTEDPPFRLLDFIRDALQGLGHGVRRVSAYVPLAAGLLIVAVAVPVVGTVISMIGGAIVSSRFAAYDAYDAVFARKSWTYRQKTGFLSRHRVRSYALGALTAALMMLPVLNLLALSVAATAATLAFLELGSASTLRTTVSDEAR